MKKLLIAFFFVLAASKAFAFPPWDRIQPAFQVDGLSLSSCVVGNTGASAIPISSGPAVLYGIYFGTGSAGATIDVFDVKTATTHPNARPVFNRFYLDATQQLHNWEGAINCSSGIFVTHTGVGAATYLYRMR